MMKPQKDDYGKYKAATYGMGWGLLITLVIGYLFEDYALGLVLGL